MLVIGTVGLLYLKWQSDPVPAERRMARMDVAFLLALLLTSVTGLLLLALRETPDAAHEADDPTSTLGWTEPTKSVTGVAEKRAEARMKGYVGEACPECANFTLVRNGTCLKCETCGATTGCS